MRGLTASNRGLAQRIEFSTRRSGVQIRWETSQRLISGSMVALTPVNDMFKSVCKVAIVAARPLGNLRLFPPQIDIFFRSHKDIEIDSHQEWVMVQARNGYFESQRHTLLALQKMYYEP